MVVNLNLSGNSLIIYAAIYGLTINKGIFTGSIEYLAQWCNCSKRNVMQCIDKLLEKGLIRKKRTNKGCIYVTNPIDTTLPNSEKSSPDETFDEAEGEEISLISEKSSPEQVKKVHLSGEKSSPNKIDNKLDDNLVNTNGFAVEKNQTQKYTEFLNSISETDRSMFEKCVTELYEFRRNIDPKFIRNSSQLLKWQFDLALFANKENRDSQEIYDTLTFALSSKFWSSIMFTPDNLIKNYEKIFQKANVKSIGSKVANDKISFADEINF